MSIPFYYVPIPPLWPPRTLRPPWPGPTTHPRPLPRPRPLKRLNFSLLQSTCPVAYMFCFLKQPYDSLFNSYSLESIFDK